MKKVSCLLVLSFSLLLPSFPATAQEMMNDKQELQVSLEDELAPVKEIEATLKDKLSKPITALDLDLIMEGPAFFGYTPRFIAWSPDGEKFWFTWQRWNEERSSIFEYSVAAGKLQKLDTDTDDLIPSAWRTAWRTDHSEAVWSNSTGLVSMTPEETSYLIEGLAGIRFLDYAEGEGYLIEYQNNVFLLNKSGQPALKQLSNIRSGNKKDDDPKTENQRWLKKQQLALFNIINKRKNQREESKAEREKSQPAPYYLGRHELSGLAVSRDGVFAALLLRARTNNDRVAEMPEYVTESGYTESRKVRIKVGDAQDSYAITMLHLSDGSVAAIDFGLEDREFRIMSTEWSPDNRHLLVQLRALDNKDRWFFMLTPSLQHENETTELKVNVTELAHDHDDAWISWDVAGNNGWLPDGSGIYFVSEREGWRNLYVRKLDSDTITGAFTGKRIIHSLQIHHALNGFIVAASFEGNPHEVQSFLLSVNDLKATQITEGLGRAIAYVSPDGSHIATIASYSNKPPELFVKQFRSSGLGAAITDSPSPAFKSWDWIDPPIIHFKATDGTMVPAQIYVPTPENANGAGIVFVHGAGYMQNVHRWWRGSSYGRTYCFQHMLAEAGYTVIDIDYRGSEGYGRDWRTAIYRRMGGKDLSDQVDGANFLIKNYGIKPGHIGLYGGSYGGFLTLMALFQHPETFSAGVAMRPVTDWSAYNHPYTSNILNTPQDDPEAYIFSSPIYYAEGLRGNLLITHGIEDDNVHIQGVFRLIQRLIELRKKNWNVAVYPIEPHGFREPSSWVDQYYRIKKLFDESIAP